MGRSRGALGQSIIIRLLVVTVIGATAGAAVAAERNVLGEYFTMPN